MSLPPAQITGPSAWYGPDMAQRSAEWIRPFTAAEIAEIAAVAGPLAEQQVEIASLRQADFPLPTLGPILADLKQEILEGRGFALLRGLPVADWGLRMAATAFYGVGLHFGRACSQNGKGHVLGHVQDLGLSSKDPNVRIYQTSERQTFHTDSCDIVGLLCLKQAKRGGHSALVSSVTIYNEMMKRSDLARHLFAPLATDRRGEIAPGEKPYFEIPVFNWHAGLLSAIYQRQYIDSAQRFEDAPRLSAETVAALDLFDALADDPALNFEMVLEPGDIQLVHNHNLLHDRTGFEDWPEDAEKRHLLRLWLSPEDARPLPEVFRQRFGSIEPGRRGGIILEETKLVAPMTARG
ncbi:TauD/TfdA family dioxygenase [Lacibacterium aquatile]|uniref:TauD/TfdA family dioxygenase n=1 Tax=Lacibacterium aquatile TaxID=1168082 RepID=A0ABW5DMH3_9PROT